MITQQECELIAAEVKKQLLPILQQTEAGENGNGNNNVAMRAIVSKCSNFRSAVFALTKEGGLSEGKARQMAVRLRPELYESAIKQRAQNAGQRDL